MARARDELDTRELYIPEDMHFIRHTCVIVDANADDGMEWITYYNGNSLVHNVITDIGDWRRMLVWRGTLYGNCGWYITDYVTGETQWRQYPSRKAAIQHCAEFAKGIREEMEDDCTYREELACTAVNMRYMRKYVSMTNTHKREISMSEVLTYLADTFDWPTEKRRRLGMK